MIKTVRLATRVDRIARDFPDLGLSPRADGIGFADYQVDLDSFGDDGLARYLAENIPTTERGLASRLLLVSVHSYGEQVLETAIRRHLRRAVGDGPAHLAAQLRALADAVEAEDPEVWAVHRSTDYQWPIYGAMRVDAETPEDYFRSCARVIRDGGWMPLKAGPEAVRPSMGLLRTFAGGHGVQIAERFWAARPPAE